MHCSDGPCATVLKGQNLKMEGSLVQPGVRDGEERRGRREAGHHYTSTTQDKCAAGTVQNLDYGSGYPNLRR